MFAAGAQIPTSVATQKQAESLNIPLCTLNEESELDVAIDGADSVDAGMVRRHVHRYISLCLCLSSPPAPLLSSHSHRRLLPAQNLVKGGGGALLREKMVEVAAKQFVVIVDQSKLSDGLGPHFPVPVEIVSFCHEHTMRLIAALPCVAAAGCNPVLRLGSSSNNKVDGEEIAVTDNGNYIVDLHFESPLADPVAAANEILAVVGVVEQCVR